MDLVKGVPITDYCDAQQLTVRQRLELFTHICHAVQHAHQKGIIHRDIKPSNVLVAEYDGKPVPKVIDFGVAKAVSQRLNERTMFTEYGQLIGTFEYMSPEQARFNQLDVDTRSDIYSLGVILYELLTGSTPLERHRLETVAFDETLRIIREEEPPKPSTRLSGRHAPRTVAVADDTRSVPATIDLAAIAANRRTEPARLSRLVTGELDWIVMKALEKDRNRRYETANALLCDIERFLHDEPVQACPPSAAYRFRRFARRNKAALLAAVAAFAVLLMLVAGLAVSNRLIAAERNQKAHALREKEKALAEAKASARAAEAQRRRAEENFRKARLAVANIIAQPAAGMGEWSQLTIPLRKKFSQEAANYYRDLLQEGDADPSLRYQTAVGYRSLAFLNYRFREYEEAEKLLRQSIAILEPLVREHPEAPEYRHQDAWSHVVLGWTLIAVKRPAEGADALERACGLYEKLVLEAPDNVDYLDELTRTYRVLIDVYYGLTTETQQRESDKIDLLVQSYREIHAQRDAKIANPIERAKLHIDSAHFLARLGRFSEAAEALDQGLELDPSHEPGWRMAATLYLWNADFAKYRLACREMLQRIGPADKATPYLAGRTAKLCSLAPGAVESFALVEKLAERGMSDPKSVANGEVILSKALTDYRAGRPADAVACLEELGAHGDKMRDPAAKAVLAMAYHRIGKSDEARPSLRDAQAWLKLHMPAPIRADLGSRWTDWLHARMLCDEAEKVLEEPAADTTEDPNT